MGERIPGSDVRGDKGPMTYTEGAWPHSAVPAPEAPVGVHYALALARVLDNTAAARGLSHRAVSAEAGLNATAVGRIVRGEVYPDLATIARLERALGTLLLPNDRLRLAGSPAAS
ncbi:hypothetical protein ABH926_007195 [Catenulispora sp. GP43]